MTQVEEMVAGVRHDHPPEVQAEIIAVHAREVASALRARPDVALEVAYSSGDLSLLEAQLQLHEEGNIVVDWETWLINGGTISDAHFHRLFVRQV